LPLRGLNRNKEKRKNVKKRKSMKTGFDRGRKFDFFLLFANLANYNFDERKMKSFFASGNIKMIQACLLIAIEQIQF
jgi:hypothetical protein